MRWSWGLLLGLGLGLVGPLKAQVFDDFNDGNDDGWSKVDLSVIGSGAQITFPDDGEGGKAYRIHAPKPALEGYGPARAFSYRQESYTRMLATVDLLNWDTTTAQAFGLLVRATDLALGQVNGYALTYDLPDGGLEINLVAREDPTSIASTPVALHPDRGPYRLVFSAYEGVLMGELFSMGDLQNPLAAVFAIDGAYPGGRSGLVVLDFDGAHADATFDNYSVEVPPEGSLRATVLALQPAPFEVLRVSQPEIRVSIVDRETYADETKVRFWMNGIEIPRADLDIGVYLEVPGNPGAVSGVTMIYQPSMPLEAERIHTARVVYEDYSGGRMTNEWTFVGVPLLRAEHALPMDAGEERGFAVRLVQTIGPEALANSLDRAEQQLAIPPEIRIDMTTNTTAQVINYTKNALPSSDGYFPDEATFPGIDPAGNTDDFAMEAFFYLELSAGFHRFGVRSDDGFQLSTGSSMANVREVVLGEQRSGTYDGTFEFEVEADGLYPFRLVHFERGGAAHVELFTVDWDDSSKRTLINDPQEAGAIRAWMTVSAVEPLMELESAPALAPGAFATDRSAVVDPEARTVTVPWGGAGHAQFYRLRSETPLRITQIAIVGDDVILTYQPEP